MSAFLSFHEPGFWLVVGLLCGIALLAAWPFVPQTRRSWLLLAYWLLVPYLALISGGVSPRLMGLYHLDWPNSLRLGVGIVFVLLVAVAVARIGLSVDQRRQGADVPGAELSARSERWAKWLAAIGLCGAEEFFWSFLRGALWEIALSFPETVKLPAYWAVWLAALLALPFVLVFQPSAPARLIKIAILVATSILFFYTRNFWLCWFLHATMWLALAPLSDKKEPRMEQIGQIGADSR